MNDIKRGNQLVNGLYGAAGQGVAAYYNYKTPSVPRSGVPSTGGSSTGSSSAGSSLNISPTSYKFGNGYNAYASLAT